MDRRQLLTTGALFLAGCNGLNQSGGSDDIQDSDGDGVIDSEDYAPNDPDVQEKSDLQGGSTATPTSTPTATQSPTPTPTPEPTPTRTPFPDADDDGARDRFDDFPNDPDYTEKHAEDEGTKHLVSGEYFWWEWDQYQEITIGWSVEVTEGSAIDAIVIDEDEFSDFEDNEEYEYYTYGTDLETKRASQDVTLSEGSYRFILSNRGAGSEESATVDYYYVRGS